MVFDVFLDVWLVLGYMKINNNDVNGGIFCGVLGVLCLFGDW